MFSDPAAERGVLAGILKYGIDAYVDVADLLSANSFTIDSNQIIWSCLAYLLADGTVTKPDLPTLLSASAALGMESFFQNKEERDHLGAIARTPVDASNIGKLAGKVKKLEIAKDAHLALQQAQDALLNVTGDESIDAILGMAENPLFELTGKLAGNNNNSGLMGEGAEEYYRYLIENPRQLMGISSGFPRWDRIVGGGLREGCLDLWGARNKSGKSFCADNVSLHVAANNIPVLNVDGEMNKEQHLVRIGAYLTGCYSESIERGDLPPDKRELLYEAGRKLKGMPYWYECTVGATFEDVLARIRRFFLRRVGLGENGKVKPCVVVYDYFKLMGQDQIKHSLKEYQVLAFNIVALKSLISRYGASCLCFAQLNRDGLDKEDSRVLRGSDQILDTVTSFSIYKWKTIEERLEYPQGKKYTHKLIPILSRFGQGLKSDTDYINVESDYAKARITEGPLNSELAGIAVGDMDGGESL